MPLRSDFILTQTLVLPVCPACRVPEHLYFPQSEIFFGDDLIVLKVVHQDFSYAQEIGILYHELLEKSSPPALYHLPQRKKVLEAQVKTLA